MERMRVNWNNYVPKLLKLDKGHETTPAANGELTEAMHQRALIILDKSFVLVALVPSLQVYFPFLRYSYIAIDLATYVYL